MSLCHLARATKRRAGATPASFDRPALTRKILDGLAVTASGTLLVFGVAAHADTSTTTIPGGTQSYSNRLTGNTGPAGTGDGSTPLPGGTGLDPGSLLAVLGGNLTGGGSGPAIELIRIGGTGGTGNDTHGADGLTGDGSGHYGGNGGSGGTPSLLQLTVASGLTVSSNAVTKSALSMVSQGGTGGYAGNHEDTYGYAGSPGDGGAGGTVSLELDGAVTSTGAWNGSTPGTTAVSLSSIGGNAGGPNPENGNTDGRQTGGKAIGRVGGKGGDGGEIDVTIKGGSITSGGSALVVLSQGGSGGNGQDASVDAGGSATGGAGGAGGSGGAIHVTVAGDGTQTLSATGASTVATGATLPVDQDGTVQAKAALFAAGIQLQSFGADGGKGGSGDGSFGTGKGGAGGAAGGAGAITLTLNNTNIVTTGYAAGGVLAQSVGGSGGNGASAGGVGAKKGGNGGIGGNAGSVTLDFASALTATAPAAISTAGDDSSGVIAQSIGGGGGAGGSVQVSSALSGIAIGGDGETGGVAGVVNVHNGHLDGNGKPADQGLIVQTTGDRASGIVAQSIGGGGGSGGSASSDVFGPFSMTIGGNGGTGGSAGKDGINQVTVYNSGIVQTSGDHAKGIEAQAIGGGGGSGGAASAMTASAQLNISLAVGGTGGTGATAGDVFVQNDGQILTQGSDAWGVLAQSIGGGGGDGGASKAYALQAANSGEAPSLNMTVAVGGNGGTGGDAGQVQVLNNFSIMTSGNGSHGINAQSIGGGGGTGGDSSTIQSNVMGSNFNFQLALGGKGGAGGSGDSVDVHNTGLIWTTGWFSYGVLAQSIGGGGGNGGNGSTDSSSFHGNGSNKTSELSVAVGGEGGTGNVGGLVTIENDSTVMTRGDLSRGLFAQSVGGGGGSGGTGTGNGTGGTVQVNVGIGGSGGTGNDGGIVHITNTGNVFTKGADAAAIYGQSIGGGGGTGGAGAAGGGTDPEVRAAGYLEGAVGLSDSVTKVGDRVYAWKDNTHGDFNAVDWFTRQANYYEDQNKAKDASPPADGEGGGTIDVTVDVGAGRGGKGGSAGDGMTVILANAGNVQTMGPASEGIFAQSVGGGGGDGGSVQTSNNPVNAPKNLSATIGVGGAGGSAGKGGAVWVDNTGSIQTAGDQSHGINAQSVGGGGGSGGYSQTEAGAVHDLSVTIGGDAGSGGKGGAVFINQSGGAVGTITTQGDDAVGIVAQSIGGGGGNVSLMHTELDAGTGGAVSHSETYNQATLMSVELGGRTTTNCGSKTSTLIAASCGDGGEVKVKTDIIATAGRNSYGVFAQSIGGGGGWITGGTLSAQGVDNLFSTFGDGKTANGNGQAVTVETTGNVVTKGDGAIGIVAQSIGGAGLFAGDTASGTGAAQKFDPVNIAKQGAATGNGGDVNVTVDQGTTVSTSGANAHGIFAQSAGGGGGYVTSTDNLVTMGSGGGVGTSGQIDVTVNGKVQTTGQGSSAVYVNADGGSASISPVTVTVNSGGSVIGQAGGIGGTGITINSSATTNIINNHGVIAGLANSDGGDVSNSHAIKSTGTGAVTVNNSGYLSGSVYLPGGTLNNVPDSLGEGDWAPGSYSVAGKVVNRDEIDLPASTSMLLGDFENYDLIYAQGLDFYNKTGSQFQVTGNVTMGAGGRFLIGPVAALTPTPYTILTATKLTMDAVPSVSAQQGLSHDTTMNGLPDQVLYKAAASGNAVTITASSNMYNAAKAAGGSATQQSVAKGLDADFKSTISESQAKTYATLANISDHGQFLNAMQPLTNEAVQSVGTSRLTASHAFVERMNSCPQFERDGAELRERECAWSRVITTRTDRGNDGDGVGYGQDATTIQVGGQRRIADDWFLGGSLSYDTSNARDLAHTTSLRGRNVGLGVVLKRQLDNWLFTGAIDLGSGTYDSERHVQFGDTDATAKASFDAQHIGLHARIARQIPLQGWYLKPYVDLHATRMHTGAYTEQGAGDMDLAVRGETDTAYAASPMLEMGKRFDFRNGMTVHSYVSAGMTFYSANEWGAQQHLAGAGDDSAGWRAISSLPTQRAKIAAGANLTTTKNLDVRLEYSGEFANGYHANTGSVKLSYQF